MNKKILIPSILAAVGLGFIAVNLIKRNKQKKATAPGSVDKTSGSTAGVPTSPAPPFTPSGGIIAAGFPLKRGSKGTKVIELQQAIGKALLPKFGFDGDYGSETENAVLKLLNKSTVDSQSDIDKIKALQAQTTLEQKKYAAGQKLIKSYQDNTSLALMPTKATEAIAVTINYQNHWIFGSKKLLLPANKKLNRYDYRPMQVSGIGNMLIKVTNGALEGYYVGNPLDFTLINNSPLSFIGPDGGNVPEIWPT